jgi:hypothetical protein
VVIVVYQFAHGFNVSHMANEFNVGTSTIKKYVDIVCDVLMNKNKLFSKYINIPSSQCLRDINLCFETLRGIPNICGIIKRTHIPFVNLPSKIVTLTIGDFFNKKKFHDIVLQVVCDVNKIFGTFVLANFEGFMMVDN